MVSIPGKTATLKIDDKVIECVHWDCELIREHPERIKSFVGTLLITGDHEEVSPGSKAVLDLDNFLLEVIITKILFSFYPDNDVIASTEIEFESTGPPLRRDQLRDLQELIAEVLDEQ